MHTEYLTQSPPLLKEFLGYLQTVKGKSPATVDEYFMDLRTFFRYMKKVRGLVPAKLSLDKIQIDDTANTSCRCLIINRMRFRFALSKSIE